MKLFLISLHLCVLSTWSVSLNTDNVRQTADIDVFEGEFVNIYCCWTGGRGEVMWFKNDSPLTDMTLETHNNEMEECSILNFVWITKWDSGRYVCEITFEIPVFAKIRGNGTTITVKTRKEQAYTIAEAPAPPDRSSVITVILLPVVLPLLLSITVFLFLHEPRNHALTSTVVFTVTCSDSEEEQTATCSPWRGCSQWESECSSLICYKKDQTRGSGERSAAVST
ncbi:hypothetical protein FQA47_001396 [Oryzias melastigma]|uniref:Ig-like domain-containing protein n=1 Tax=Oryzias melastigma TaxID=30732 RepID=A0A834L2C6_ORYME|nr:uncharacterized protein LOC112156031 [Oryzias melastigma]KAF6739044.1 hypothetical protein FQA47_001396 [Oryzias melastigma]